MIGAEQRLRILIADDERLILKAYQRIFTNDGGVDPLEAELFGSSASTHRPPQFSIEYFQQGEEAVAAVRQACSRGEPFSLAFLDVRMPPGIDGIEVAGQIRAVDSDINIVIVTGYSDLSPQAIAEQVPPAEKLFFIAKPFQTAEIQQFASALTRRWQVERELMAAHRQLQQRCVALEEACREALRERDQAAQVNNAKTELLAGVSRELRTPLNAIVGFSELMMHRRLGELTPEEHLNYNRDIHASGRHLLSLVDDILDLSKIEAGKLEVQRKLIDLPEVAGWVRRLIEPLARNAGLALEVRVDEGRLPRLCSDERRLAQILINLLDNAVKFTPSGGRVTLTVAREEPDDVRFEIADTGVGIAPEVIERVQLPVEQTDNDVAQNTTSSGLGLPLVQTLTAQLGGSFAIASDRGTGTSAIMILPGNGS